MNCAKKSTQLGAQSMTWKLMKGCDDKINLQQDQYKLVLMVQ